MVAHKRKTSGAGTGAGSDTRASGGYNRRSAESREESFKPVVWEATASLKENPNQPLSSEAEKSVYNRGLRLK